MRDNVTKGADKLSLPLNNANRLGPTLMEHSEDQKMKALLAHDVSDESDDARLNRVMRRVRAGVGQRDTLMFAFARFWTVVAEMLAPMFAQIARRRVAAQSVKKPETPIDTNKPNP